MRFTTSGYHLRALRRYSAAAYSGCAFSAAANWYAVTAGSAARCSSSQRTTSCSSGFCTGCFFFPGDMYPYRGFVISVCSFDMFFITTEMRPPISTRSNSLNWLIMPNISAPTLSLMSIDMSSTTNPHPFACSSFLIVIASEALRPMRDSDGTQNTSPRASSSRAIASPGRSIVPPDRPRSTQIVFSTYPCRRAYASMFATCAAIDAPSVACIVVLTRLYPTKPVAPCGTAWIGRHRLSGPITIHRASSSILGGERSS